LTRAESKIMRVIWDKQSATVHEVLEGLADAPAYTTALTLLKILEQKGYVARGPHPDGGRAHVYRPLVPATQAQRLHVRDLVDRLFAGSSEELMVGLLEDEQLTRADLERMQQTLASRLQADATSPGAGGKGKKRND
jgi:predicted transcriptional regulator